MDRNERRALKAAEAASAAKKTAEREEDKQNMDLNVSDVNEASDYSNELIKLIEEIVCNCKHKLDSSLTHEQKCNTIKHCILNGEEFYIDVSTYSQNRQLIDITRKRYNSKFKLSGKICPGDIHEIADAYEVDLSGSDAVDVSSLHGVRRLIANNTNITKLPDGMNLTRLEVANSRITELPKNTPKLQKLNISKTKITTLPENAPELIEVNAKFSNLMIIPFNARYITSMNLTGTKIQNTDSLIHAKSLYLNDVQLPQSEIDKLSNVHTLHLSHVKTLTDLTHLKKVKDLSISHTNISDPIPVLAVEKFNISYTKITTLPTLQYLTHLTAHYTPLKDITFLERSPNLQYLDISFTTITDLTPLRNLTKLSHVIALYTQIADISPIAHVATIEWNGVR